MSRGAAGFSVAAMVLILSSQSTAALVQTVLNLDAHDVVYDRVSDRLFVTVGDADLVNGNSIVVVNPHTGQIENSVFVGSNPDKMAISADGSTVYVGLYGAGAVRRFDTRTQTAGLQFSLGNGSFGPRYAEDLSVQPGNNDAVAVSLARWGVSPRHDGVALFVNGAMLPLVTSDHTGSNVIEFSDSPNLLYGYNNETSESGFRSIRADANGLTQVQVTRDLTGGNDFLFAGGKVFTDGGRVVDPVQRTLLGTFAASGSVAVDPWCEQAFFLTGTDVLIFDTGTYLRTDTLDLTYSGSELVQWGGHGLAYVGSSDKLVIVEDPRITPEPTALGILAVAAAGMIRRRRFGRCP